MLLLYNTTLCWDMESFFKVIISICFFLRHYKRRPVSEQKNMCYPTAAMAIFLFERTSFFQIPYFQEMQQWNEIGSQNWARVRKRRFCDKCNWFFSYHMVLSTTRPISIIFGQKRTLSSGAFLCLPPRLSCPCFSTCEIASSWFI